MKTILALSIIFCFCYADAQNVIIKEIKLLPNAKFYSNRDTTIIYPVVVTKNKAANKLINDRIREEEIPAFGDEEKLSTRKALINLLAEGTITINYTVTYLKNNMLSINIYSEECGVYCSANNAYFNFDLNTGNEISIVDIILPDKIDSFKRMVFNDKVRALVKYKREEKKIMKSHNLDTASYNIIVREIDENCINSVNVNNFSLSKNTITIKDPCEFPHFLRAEEPSFDLKYSYLSLTAFINPKFKKLLTK